VECNPLKNKNKKTKIKKQKTKIKNKTQKTKHKKQKTFFYSNHGIKPTEIIVSLLYFIIFKIKYSK